MTIRPIRPSVRRLAVGAGALAAGVLIACSGGADEATPTATSTSTDVPTATAFPTGTGAPGTATTEPTATPEGGDEATPEDAVAVLDAYFAAIGLHDYEAAYALWRGEGDASGQTYEEFAAGFAETASLSWEIGEPGRIDAGAGQRYIEVPVEITTRLSTGESQHFEGTYVLHHTANIEGSTPEQRLWRIHSAEVTEVE